MKNKKTNKALLIAGILAMSCTNFAEHYLNLPDFAYGLLTGLSCGLIVLSVVIHRIVKQVN